MQNRSDYWTAWMAGWAAATTTIIEAQQRALSMFLPTQAAQPVQRMLTTLRETAGDKPADLAPRRRGRPRKSEASAHASSTPRKRGRPPKAGRSKR